MRIVANNPELNGQVAHQAEIDPATWRNVRLRMEKPDGGELLVTLLRSAEWLETQNAEPGNTIRLTFVELGIDGPADVLAVEACLTIETGNGRVVTGTFRHSAANVIDLCVTGEGRPIGTTANHPFWSESRQDFVQAGTLQPGEELRTATGVSARVRQLTPRSRSAEVFNLEVDAEHCYAVGSNGVVVHNSDNYNDGPPNVAPSNVGRRSVLRGLANGENPALGLTARSPDAGNSVASHVAGKRPSQWISTTTDEAVARVKFGQHGYIEIDLSKVPSTIVDISGGILGMEGTMLSNWAKKMREVLIKNYIPPKAIK